MKKISYAKYNSFLGECNYAIVLRFTGGNGPTTIKLTTVTRTHFLPEALERTVGQ